MTSPAQWAASRENAQKSTAPRTEAGKRRSQRNALRHGLPAETVIETFEDVEDYKAFEANVTADYDPTTAVERELVLRLASLLWRIRRAVAIETDLLRIQAESLSERRNAREAAAASTPARPFVYRLLKSSGERPPEHRDDGGDARRPADRARGESADPAMDERADHAAVPADPSRALTHSFLRLANLDNGAFERLGRYEAALWRQIAQTLFALEPRRRRENRPHFLR